MKSWFSARELAGLPGLPGSERAIQIRAKRESWEKRRRKGRGGGWEYALGSLPIQAQVALYRREKENAGNPVPHRHPGDLTDVQRESLWDAWARKPESLKARGKKAVMAIHLYRELCARSDASREAGLPCDPKSKLIGLVADQYGVSVPTLRSWIRKVKHIHPSDWWPILTPAYCGRVKTAEFSPEAWNWFKADYLRLEGPASAACYERLMRVASEKGWKVPDLRTVQRRIRKEIPRGVRILARKGVDAVKKTYPAQERDKTVFHAMEAVNADGHRFDVFVKWPDGEVTRPIMVAWQDIYSSKILSYRVAKTENADSIRLSFGDMVETYGIPDHAYLDNGRGFAAKWLTGGAPNRFRFKIRPEDPTGIMVTMGVQIHWTTPYHGQAKPIERAFRDLCEYVAKHPKFSGAYTGNKPDAKPENYGSKAIDLRVFLSVLSEEIAAHNARMGRRGGIANGRSFDLIFAESYEKSVIRKATSNQFKLWLLAAEGVMVRGDGSVHLKFDRRNRYWCEELEEYAGHRVVLRFDPDKLHYPVHAFTLDNRFIGTAICLEAEGFNNVQAAKEHARNRKRYIRATKAQLEAQRRMSVLEAAAMLPDIAQADVPDAKIVRIHKPKNEPQIARPLDEEAQALIEKWEKEEADQANKEEGTVLEFGDDPIRNWQLYESFKARHTRGETLSERELDLMKSYERTVEFSAMRKFVEAE